MRRLGLRHSGCKDSQIIKSLTVMNESVLHPTEEAVVIDTHTQTVVKRQKKTLAAGNYLEVV